MSIRVPSTVRRAIERLQDLTGYHVSRLRAGDDRDRDISMLLDGVRAPVVMDVGSKNGAWALGFRERFPDAEIHCLEPGLVAQELVERNTLGVAGVHVHRLAAGAEPGVQTFFEYEDFRFGSLLRPGSQAYHEVVAEREVPIVTLDGFCSDHAITSVDLLKCTTAGYELEVFKGAEELFARSKVKVVYTQPILLPVYDDLAGFDAIYRFLVDRGLQLVALYNYVLDRGVSAWCDALFALPHATR